MTVSNPESGAQTIAPPFQVAGELNLTRVFDARREIVFQAWVNREHLERWWGPHGFSTKNIEMDVRAGGAWRYFMHGPDGNDYPWDGVYVQVVAPELIIFDGAINGSPDLRVWTEVVFSDHGEQTEVKVRQLYSFQSAATSGAPIGWSQQFDRLAEILAE
jgi:uncharacterized protein YndB with AHSA1/START domain